MDGKQLRNSILQWAIQGKLVPQDPNDEPASVLLERIREEKARLVKEKKIKRDKNESIIYRGEDNSYYEKFADGKVVCIAEEPPFEIPQGWEWARLCHLTALIEDCPHSTAKDEGVGYALIRTPNIGFGELLLNSVHRVSETVYNQRNSRAVPETDDLIFAREAPAGNIAIIKDGEKVCLGQRTVLLRPMKEFVIPKYIVYYILSPSAQQNLVEKSSGTTVAHVNLADFRPYLVAVPPKEEQRRIVSVIEKTMPLINKYGHLTESLKELNNSISDLIKKSILQEAIQGKLVNQNPDDEPASVLLKRIKQEKERLIKEKKIKRDKLESIIYRGDDNKYYENLNGAATDITDQILFDIPTSWQWVRLRTLCNITTGASFKKEEASAQGENKVRILRGGNILPYRLLLKGDDIFIDKELVNENILLRQNDLVTPAVTSLENICKMARIEKDYDDMTMGGFVFIIRGFYNDTSSPTTIEFVRSITNKSGQAFYNIGKERLSNTLIPMPPFEEMGKITSRIETLFQSLN